MAEHSIRIRLIDIQEEIAGIRRLTEDATPEVFDANWGMKRAVQHALLIISEATRHIPDDLKKTRPEVPWQKIHSLGNMLRHEYREINSDIVWSIITGQLDDLDRAAAALLTDRPE